MKKVFFGVIAAGSALAAGIAVILFRGRKGRKTGEK